MEEKLTRLRRLRDALAAAGKTSRTGIERWVEQARPVIEADWPDELRGFQAVAAPPAELTGPEAEPGSPEFHRQRRRTREWSQHLYSFVSRLLREAERATKPAKPRVDRERRHRYDALKTPLGITSIAFSVITLGVMLTAVAMSYKQGHPPSHAPEVTFTVQPAGPYGPKAPVVVKPHSAAPAKH